MQIKTSSWFTDLPEGHVRIGISRGVPRRMTAGYRVFKTLAPGPWFNSVSVDEYYHRYRTEILGPLDPRVIASHLVDLAPGAIPVMLCYEQPGKGQWCHRAMAAEWLAEALGRPVPEVGFEALPQEDHPLMPPELRRQAVTTEPPDLQHFVGREATIDGQLHRVVGVDPVNPRRALIAVADRKFPAGIETLERHFSKLL